MGAAGASARRTGVAAGMSAATKGAGSNRDLSGL